MGTATTGGVVGSASVVDGTDDACRALVPPAGATTAVEAVTVVLVVPRSNIQVRLGEPQYLNGGGGRVESITSDSVYLPSHRHNHNQSGLNTTLTHSRKEQQKDTTAAREIAHCLR